MNRLVYIVPIIGVATGWLYFLTTLAPTAKDTNLKASLQFPGNLQELQELAKLLSQYYEINWFYVIVLFSSAYLYKQSFMIPGSALLNLLAGALFGLMVSFPLVCLLTGMGASCCFLLSKHLGKEFLQQKFPNKINWLQDQVASNRERLPYYLLFLRLFPMSPNWLLNVLCPLAGIPLPLFAFTATVGLMPYNFVCVHAGCMLASLTSLDSLFSVSTLLQMALLAVVALGPSLIIKKSNLANSFGIKKDQ